ncbi:MAG: hypothetical protein EBR82_46075 [Caulobacteraceae bacterium]|nr:hypothetical protein [Caulobacteraceae bacterium]
MLTGIVFGRRKPGGNGGVHASVDLFMSRVMERQGRECLSMRLHGDVMRRLRWMMGDYVRLRPEDDGQKWVVERVSGPKQGGMKITSASGKSYGHGNVRFTVDAEVLNEVFRDHGSSFTATMCDSNGNEATFLVD